MGKVTIRPQKPEKIQQDSNSPGICVLLCVLLSLLAFVCCLELYYLLNSSKLRKIFKFGTKFNLI